jgi:hypothetical protein
MTSYIVNAFKIFTSCNFDKTDPNLTQKELNCLPNLIQLQKWANYYILHFCLCVADRASTNSKKEDLTLHMCALLVRKGFIKSNTNKTMFESKEDLNLFMSFFEAYNEPQYVIINGIKEKLPTFMIGEGTGFVSPYPTSQPIQSNIKHYIKKESIKERLFISSEKIQFYKYALMGFTNEYIDKPNPLNIQSFMFTYKKQLNSSIDESFDKNSFIYGVNFKHLFENENDVELVPTPKYNNSTMELTKKLSRTKLAFPPCFINPDGTFLSKYKVDKVPSLISTEKITQIFKDHKNEINNDPFSDKDENSQYMLVAPRVFKSVYDSIPKEVIQRINVLQFHADFYMIVIWIKIDQKSYFK